LLRRALIDHKTRNRFWDAVFLRRLQTLRRLLDPSITVTLSKSLERSFPLSVDAMVNSPAKSRGFFLALCSGRDLEFKLQTDLHVHTEARAPRGFFRSGPGRQEGSACSVHEMDSGASGTPQRDVHAVVRHIVGEPDLHVLACGSAAIEHGGHA
jgi:hypothetical protein